jgi:glycosyltransferase involved in cell wall biosynthesis
MKVLMISEYFPPETKGGGEISAFLLAKELVKSGVEMHVLTSYFGGKKKEVMDGVVVHRRLTTGRNPVKLLDNLKRRVSFERSLVRELVLVDKEEKFDIIHCMNITSINAVRLKKRLGKRFILHVNSPVLFCPKGTLMYKERETCDRECTLATFVDCYLSSNLVGKMELKPVLKYNPAFVYAIRRNFVRNFRLMREFDHYMPISEYMKKRLLLVGIPEEKITVVYNIVELDRFLKLKPPNNKVPKILYLGEFSKPKGVPVLVEALKGIKEPYEANFYGSGVLKGYLMDKIKENKLNAFVHGPVDYEDVPKVMQKHDIVVFPSLVAEAFGRVVLEACAAGKTVIASDVGGVGEILKKNKKLKRIPYTVLVKNNRPSELSKALNLNMKYGKNKLITRGLFDWGSSSDMYKVYKEMMVK